MKREEVYLGQFILRYSSRSLSKAKCEGQESLTKYLRGVASNFIHRKDVIKAKALGCDKVCIGGAISNVYKLTKKFILREEGSPQS